MTKIVLIFLLFCAQLPLVAQLGTEQCLEWCKANQPECHMLRSNVYLDVSHFQSDACWAEFKLEAKTLSRREQLERSLQELQLAASNQTWAKQQGGDLLIEIADRQMIVGHELLKAKDITSSDRVLDEASVKYLDILKTKGSIHLSHDQFVKIAVGLIRCGHLVDSLAALDNLDAKDGERLYLSAEVLNELGERELAAEKFQEWIHGGCISTFPLLTNNEFHPVWGILYLPSKSMCEQIPSQVWSEMQELNKQFEIPMNLPAHNQPPELMRF